MWRQESAVDTNPHSATLSVTRRPAWDYPRPPRSTSALAGRFTSSCGAEHASRIRGGNQRGAGHLSWECNTRIKLVCECMLPTQSSLSSSGQFLFHLSQFSTFLAFPSPSSYLATAPPAPPAMDEDERDIWSSPDPDQDHASSTLQQTASPIDDTVSPSNRNSVHGLYADDLALDAGWGAPTPTTASTVKQEPAAAAIGGQEASAEAKSASSADGENAPKASTLSPPVREGPADGSASDDNADGDDEFADTLEAPHVSGANSAAASPAGAGTPEAAAENDEFADFDEPVDAQGAAQDSEAAAAVGGATAAAKNEDDDFGDFGDFDDFPDQSQQADGDADFGDDDDDAFGEAQAAPSAPPAAAQQPDWVSVPKLLR